jgi:type VI secretion system protein ImpF
MLYHAAPGPTAAPSTLKPVANVQLEPWKYDTAIQAIVFLENTDLLWAGIYMHGALVWVNVPAHGSSVPYSAFPGQEKYPLPGHKVNDRIAAVSVWMPLTISDESTFPTKNSHPLIGKRLSRRQQITRATHQLEETPMPGSNPEVRTYPSILDRLLDDEPEVAREPLHQRFHGVQQLKRAVTRDLEALFNTRQEQLTTLPAACSEVQHSLLIYGLPDFTAWSLLSSADRQRLRRVLEQAIATCEPRLTRVQVTLEPPREYERVVRFRVEALLRVEPVPESVTFDAVLQLHTLEYVVRG